MADLTKEYFDQQLKSLVNKTDFEQLLSIIKTGFDNTANKQDFETLNDKIDQVDERLQTVETKLDRALYTELVHLESRLRRVEEKVGIKPAVKPANS